MFFFVNSQKNINFELEIRCGTLREASAERGIPIRKILKLKNLNT